VFPHLPVRRDAFILRVIDRYIAANISGMELQETEPVSRHKFRSRLGKFLGLLSPEGTLEDKARRI
jgi:hypothetical protein